MEVEGIRCGGIRPSLLAFFSSGCMINAGEVESKQEKEEHPGVVMGHRVLLIVCFLQHEGHKDKHNGHFWLIQALGCWQKS